MYFLLFREPHSFGGLSYIRSKSCSHFLYFIGTYPWSSSFYLCWNASSPRSGHSMSEGCGMILFFWWITHLDALKLAILYRKSIDLVIFRVSYRHLVWKSLVRFRPSMWPSQSLYAFWTCFFNKTRLKWLRLKQNHEKLGFQAHHCHYCCWYIHLFLNSLLKHQPLS